MSDRDRRRNPINAFGRRLVQSLEKLPCVSGEALDVPALTFRIQRVKGKAGLAAAADAADDHQLAVGNVKVDLLQVVDLNAAK